MVSSQVDPEKENKRVSVSSESASVVSDDESDSDDGSRKQWSDAEKTKIFKWFLGDDEDGKANHRFEQHKKNPGRVYNAAARDLFNNKHTPKSVGSLWQRSFTVFEYIRAFESFTGNGGGDPDSDESDAISKRLNGACKAGLPVGTLKPSVIEMWETNGWHDLANQRYGMNAKVSRAVVRNSASALSDIEEDLNGCTSDNIDPTLLADDLTMPPPSKTPAPAKNPAAVVSEPRFTLASKFRTQASTSMGNMGELVRMKMVSEEKKAKGMEEKLGLDKEKLDLEKKRVEVDTQQAKVQMARTILEMDGADAEVRKAANHFLLNLFT
ncbi:Histone acetyltransferase [Mycena venus]|uniref:Histone acetyltransferase n=1 Tax=Mycena venus TaxID=2733690 RepID=A0A8H7DI09_9AGAR|nr:Histone acetyltransferase [Mycena venus]